MVGARTHVRQFLCVKMPVAPAAIFETVAPDAMKEIWFAAGVQDGVAFDGIRPIGISAADCLAGCPSARRDNRRMVRDRRKGIGSMARIEYRYRYHHDCQDYENQ